MATVNYFVTLSIIYFSLTAVVECGGGYEYNEQLNGALKLHRVPTTWDDARIRCHDEGGVLMSPLNETFMAAMTKAMAVTRNSPRQVFIGVHSKFSDGDFVSVEGVPIHEMDITWSIGEPKSSVNTCTLMYPNGEVATASCSDSYPYICFKKGKQYEIPPCCTSDKEYKFNNLTRSCYKFHKVGRTWARAFETCHAEGAHLAIINSEIEAKVISELFMSVSPKDIFADYTHVASIGYLNWGVTGSWWTVHGEDLHEAGYAKWSQGNPSDSQFCGGVNTDGTLNDIWCREHTFALICEMPVKSSPQVPEEHRNSPQFNFREITYEDRS